MNCILFSISKVNKSIVFFPNNDAYRIGRKFLDDFIQNFKLDFCVSCILSFGDITLYVT